MKVTLRSGSIGFWLMGNTAATVTERPFPLNNWAALAFMSFNLQMRPKGIATKATEQSKK